MTQSYTQLFSTISIILLPFLSFSNDFFDNPCDEIYYAGLIGDNQTYCQHDNDPAPIVSIEAASNGLDNFEYLWIYTTSNPYTGTVLWLSIPGATQKDYDPPSLDQTTWYRRCTRPVGCDSYGAESNIITITIEDCNTPEPCEYFSFADISVKEVTCFGSQDGSIELKLSGGMAPFLFQWSHTTDHNPIQNNLPVGAYQVFITDANGCSLHHSFEITEPEIIKVFQQKVDVICHGGQDGFIEFEAAGGKNPFTYHFQGQTYSDGIFHNLSSGNYEVVIEDANGCSQTIPFEIKEPQILSVESMVTPETCLGGDGNIQLNVNGGTAPYQVTWMTGSQTTYLENVESGKYEFTVIDANDCVISMEIFVPQACQSLVINFEEDMISNLNNEAVALNWKTFHEQDGGMYYIEHSLDGQVFKLTSMQIAGKGYDADGMEYQIIDQSPRNGLNLYRIVYVDAEGQFSNSKVLDVMVEKADAPKISVYPNPVISALSVDFLKPTEMPTSIAIINASGHILWSQSIALGSRMTQIAVADLADGQYYLNITKGNNLPYVQAFVKQ